MPRYVIGTRGSALALWQARAVERAIRSVQPGAETELRIVRTQGDRLLDRPLGEIGGKGLFTSELERALLAGEVDLCVHSMKDLPTALPAGCSVGAMLPRADARDVLVCGPRIPAADSLGNVLPGARLGTGSLRRAAQLRARFPHVIPVPIRGNVETRLAKATGGDYEGVVLAAAGVVRLAAQDHISCYLPVADMVPAAGQGAIGVEVRAGDGRLAELCAAIDDIPTSACVRAERAVLDALGGGCHAPVGAYARFEIGAFVFDAVALTPDGRHEVRACYREPASGNAGSGDLSAAVAAILRDLRSAPGFPWRNDE